MQQIPTDDLAAWLAREGGHGPRPVLLDVREEQEYRVSHLPDAIRVAPGGDNSALPEHVGKDTPIVAYCSVGYRSSALVERLRRAGYRDVRNLEGSIFEWANKGYPLYRNGEEVREVHPYNERWGRLLDAERHAYSPD